MVDSLMREFISNGLKVKFAKHCSMTRAQVEDWTQGKLNNYCSKQRYNYIDCTYSQKITKNYCYKNTSR